MREKPEPVAICRLKHVAADHKGDVRARMPKPAAKPNGKRIACVGAGPSSLTVARDLAPLGYHVTVFEADPKAGGFMRTQVPRFRLRSEEHTSELQSLMRISYAVFCLKKKKTHNQTEYDTYTT